MDLALNSKQIQMENRWKLKAFQRKNKSFMRPLPEMEAYFSTDFANFDAAVAFLPIFEFRGLRDQ